MQNATLNQLIDVFENQITFNNLLGLKVQRVSGGSALVRFENRNDLVGNFVQKTLHGGVISAVLDTTGGFAAFALLVEQMDQLPAEQKMKRLGKFGTVDLRIDYLLPGKGQYFMAESSVLRMGSKIAVCRMELHNDGDELIAVGTGTYLLP